MALDDKQQYETRQFKVVGTRVKRPDGDRQGDRQGAVRRGYHRPRHADRPGSALPARPCTDQIHRHVCGRGASRRAWRSLTRADFQRDHSIWMISPPISLITAWPVKRRFTTVTRWPLSPPIRLRLPRAALKLIKVDYDLLPHVTDVDAAMEDQTRRCCTRAAPTRPCPRGMSPNVLARYEFGHGDIDAGLAKADRVIERTYKHRGDPSGLYRTACLSGLRWVRTVRPICGVAPRAITWCATPVPRSWGCNKGSCG